MPLGGGGIIIARRPPAAGLARWREPRGRPRAEGWGGLVLASRFCPPLSWACQHFPAPSCVGVCPPLSWACPHFSAPSCVGVCPPLFVWACPRFPAPSCVGVCTRLPWARPHFPAPSAWALTLPSLFGKRWRLPLQLRACTMVGVVRPDGAVLLRRPCVTTLGEPAAGNGYGLAAAGRGSFFWAAPRTRGDAAHPPAR
jgi:hypothetical protein